jgi:hypothetical protein
MHDWTGRTPMPDNAVYYHAAYAAAAAIYVLYAASIWWRGRSPRD